MAAPESSSSSSLFALKNSRPPDDTVFYSIFPDSSITSAGSAAADELQFLHLRILHHVSPVTAPYIWQHQPFSLSITLSPLPHLSGHLRFGDNLEDEWFVVYLLFEISKTFPNLSIRVWDSDGEFLLIESAFHLPKWLNPETSVNRVFIRRGLLHIIPQSSFARMPKLEDSLRFLASRNDDSSLAPDAVQLHLRKKIVEGFYDRDIDSMKYAARMERFLPKGKGEEMVEVVIRMSRAMYAQLVQQKFQAPGCFPMPERSNVGKYMEAELGMKITCGFEMMYQLRKKQGDEGKGSTWEAFRQSLESSGYFEGLLPGSKEYKRLMENAEGYYRNSSLHVRASEVLSAPVKRIDEILALPHSADEFKNQELPPSDDDSWLYGGEDELNAALQERQNEMELYNSKHKKKQKSKEQQDGGSASGKDLDDYDLGGLLSLCRHLLRKFQVMKVLRFQRTVIRTTCNTHATRFRLCLVVLAVVLKSKCISAVFLLVDSSISIVKISLDYICGFYSSIFRNFKDVDFDVDQFMKDMETVMGHRGSKDNGSDLDLEEGSSSDLDFDALNKELKATTLSKTFVHAHDQASKKNNEEESSRRTMRYDNFTSIRTNVMGTSNANDEMDDELTPVDVDINLVKNFLDSYTSQEGLSGPASNLLGLMGLRLPDDAGKGK
ncbi:protein ecdysoneless [Sesamum angolense]|uniref:Protein ecdysoneless n=1 Tax=Sesamum angolense TaxID=2727404 RepID=A0AAE1XHS2_9LAMI|nr:protein ecdysoneless [Sesamum angolense]